MSFKVDPSALRTYARHLADAHEAAEAAKRYVHQHGSFSLHGGGLFSTVVPVHQNLMASLNQMLAHLGTLTDASGAALKQLADEYECTDRRAAGAIDAAYPAAPRRSPSRD